MKVRSAVVLGLGLAVAAIPARADEETERALAAIKSVTREGRGNESAGPAWKTLVSKGSAALLPTLAAMTDDDPTVANWLRTAVQSIAAAEKDAGRKLPAGELEAFAKDTKFAGVARRLAYELLVSQDPGAAARLLPGFLNDKNPDLRRDAIAHELEVLEKSARPSLKADLERLFAASRDKDQVELLARKLTENGGTANVTEHFGFVTFVSLVGPFDGRDRSRFETRYPPETALDTSGTFAGKDGARLRWQAVSTTDRMGTFDLNKLLGPYKDAVAYALSVIVADDEMPCEIRVSSATSVKIFLNQKELFGRDEYHHGVTFDGNVGRGTLKKGENVVVLKVCQNNQREEWAQRWQFQMRLCDATGAALPVRQKVQLAGRPQLVRLGFIPESAPNPQEKK